MKCPHCLVSFHDEWSWWVIDVDVHEQSSMLVGRTRCPSCKRITIKLGRIEEAILDSLASSSGSKKQYDFPSMIRIAGKQYPEVPTRPQLSKEVPNEFAQDYREACDVLTKSPKASAALSRRCLQSLLREKQGVKPGKLYNEIEEAITSSTLPTHLRQMLHALREVGNFVAHPTKSTTTGEIMDVEPDEAEWNLDTLEGLFDFYFIQPTLTAAKIAALNQKLQEAGKPPLK
jgi:hypothetical protein